MNMSLQGHKVMEFDSVGGVTHLSVWSETNLCLHAILKALSYWSELPYGDVIHKLMAQFRYIKIQPNTLDLSTRLWGINPTNSVIIPPTSRICQPWEQFSVHLGAGCQ